ncbi:MAG: hypothetical protein HYV15_07825 [Elusimicrobia bacterium]|nr:hypothetical protein [Elusimicrobiota bacterium]
MKALLRRLVASAAALLLCAAPGTGPTAAFAQAVAASVRGSLAAPVPVVPAGSFGAGASLLNAPLSAPGLPSALSPLAAPSLTLPTPAAAAHAAAASASAAAASAQGAAAKASAPRAASAQAVAAPAVLPASRPAALVQEQGREASPVALEVLQSAGKGFSEARQPGAAPRSGEISAALFDGTKRAGAGSAVSEPVQKGKTAPSRSGLRPALGKAAAGTAFVAAGVAGLRIAPLIAVDPAGFWARTVELTGRAGYLVGNALAFVFALPQINKTFKDGGAKGTPVWRAVVGASASLALGLVSAPLAGQWFWGVQNIFGGLALLAPLLISPLLSRRGRGFSPWASAGLTGLVSTALFVPSVALYSAAAAVVPGVLTGMLGAAGLAHLALGLQIATGAMFFLLFTPDIIDIVKGRTPKGFTSLFSFLFFAASIGFVAWTAQMASAAPAGSSERAQFIVYALQNAAYAVVSFLSWLYIRRAERGAPVSPSTAR